MNLEELKKNINASRKELEKFGIAALHVFGSVARGEAGPESDVDLLVDFREPATFDRYMKLKFFLEDLLGRRVDLLTLPAVRPEIRPRIEQDARRVA